MRLGKIEKMVTVLIIVVILMVSAIGFALQTETAVSDVEPVRNDPTATPSPTDNVTPSPTPKSDSTSVISTIQKSITTVGQGAPAPDSRGFFERTQVMDNAAWKQVAITAWSYFQPGRGIDSTTGLPAGGLGWNYFTDWDLGVYIQTVIDAQEMDLVKFDGSWGSGFRLEKVVDFLETRDLVNGTTSNIPYWVYASTGEGCQTKENIDVADAGTLLVALNNLKGYNSMFSDRIDDIVYNRVNGVSNRTDYASIVPGIKAESQSSTNIYLYYIVEGFAGFFPDELAGCSDRILDNILNAPVVPVDNVTLPQAKITCEPLLYGFFNLNRNPKLTNILNQVYAAHEAHAASTGEYVAFSEGNNKGDEFIYEWVVLPNGDTWKVTNSTSDEYQNIKPVIYTRVAISFLAIYNSTYAKDTCVYLEKAMWIPDNGYFAGADYNVVPANANFVANVGCNTNGLILAAARYASR